MPYNKGVMGKSGSNSGSDEYYTPKIYWSSIKKYIPKRKIWEAFYGDGSSAKHLESLGFKVNKDLGDFFIASSKCKDLIVSNPPFSILNKVLAHLDTIKNDFILIIPIPKIAHMKTQEILKNMNVQVIIPNHYTGFVYKGEQTRCPPVYLCYLTRGLKLPRDLLYL